MRDRRTILRGLAALPLAAAPAVATACARAVSPDPIFAAIEKHRAAEAAFQASFDLPEGGDIAALRADDLSEAEGNARTWMHDTVPQTVAGLVAYVAYWDAYTSPPGLTITHLRRSAGRLSRRSRRPWRRCFLPLRSAVTHEPVAPSCRALPRCPWPRFRSPSLACPFRPTPI